ncbi:MAG: type II toxin-antitoxin system HicB family antitoxin [Luteimonas sp.]|nr:type II toxin-antitoxin system HicB family antitoxin [Luteimonas sp.]
MNILEYKGYHGSVTPDMERGVLRGKLLFISDLVTYEADTLPGLRAEFEVAVDDYLATCEQLDRQPQQPASGSFNVRVGAERHRAAQVRAAADGVSLNEVVSRALDCYVSNTREVRERHVEKHYISLEGKGESSLSIPVFEGQTGDIRRVVLQ